MNSPSDAPDRGPRPGRRAPRGGRAGQAITEFALVLPIAVLLLGLAATGGQMLVSVINLTQAARSAAIAAQAAYEANDSPTTEAQDATTAATDEQGIVKFKCPTADGTTCVTVTNSPGTNYTLQELTTVKIFESVDPYIPIVPSITVSGTATAQSETG